VKGLKRKAKVFAVAPGLKDIQKLQAQRTCGDPLGPKTLAANPIGKRPTRKGTLRSIGTSRVMVKKGGGWEKKNAASKRGKRPPTRPRKRKTKPGHSIKKRQKKVNGKRGRER